MGVLLSFLKVPTIYRGKRTMIMANDEATRQYVTGWLNKQDWVVTATTFDGAEDGGVDITYTTSAGTFNCELKSQRKLRDDCWTADSPNVSFWNVPKKSDTYRTFDNKRSGFNVHDEVGSAATPTAFDGKRFFILNADSSGGDFMVEYKEEKYQCKWLKMLKQKQSLIILYQDGILFMDNKALRKNFIGYIRYKEPEWTNKTSSFKSRRTGKRWGIKAAIDIDGDGVQWIPIANIPKELFEKN